jgi:hypothetical protein
MTTTKQRAALASLAMLSVIAWVGNAEAFCNIVTGVGCQEEDPE